MIKVRLNRGLPGSGKSTATRNWVKEDPTNRVIVCRDNIRMMLGPYWLLSREKLVTDIEEKMVISAINRGFDVTVDATNLRLNSEARWLNVMKLAEKESELEIIDFTDVPVETCIARDLERERIVGEDVIRKMRNSYAEQFK